MIYSSSSCDNLSHNEIIERAENGDSEAQYILGIYYNNLNWPCSRMKTVI